MSLPQQAIEKLIREPSSPQGAYRQLLLIAGGLFIVMIVVYAGLAFGYQTYLRRSVAALKDKRDAVSASVPAEAQAETAAFYSQLVNLRTLLGAHSRVSPAFALVERSASPNAYFTRMNVNVATNEMTLTGAARTLKDIADQAALIERQPEVSRASFNNAGAGTSGIWQFTMTVFLKPDVLRSAAASGQVPIAPPVVTPTTTPSNASGQAPSTATTTSP